jgi:hypothetical protein
MHAGQSNKKQLAPSGNTISHKIAAKKNECKPPQMADECEWKTTTAGSCEGRRRFYTPFFK